MPRNFSATVWENFQDFNENMELIQQQQKGQGSIPCDPSDWRQSAKRQEAEVVQFANIVAPPLPPTNTSLPF